MAELNRTYISGGSQIEGNLEVNGNTVINGDLTADNLNTTGAINGASIEVTGNVKGNNIKATNSIETTSLTATGTISGATIESTGAVQGASLSISGASSLNTLSSSGKSTLNSLEVTTNETVKGNLTVNGSITCADLFLKIYPIGSIYMSVNSTNPSTLFGGTWVEWGSGRVPVGIDTSDSSFSTVEGTGGSKTNTHNHFTLFSNDGSNFYMASSTRAPRTRVVSVNRGSWNLSNGTGATREDSTHNETISVLQPYITCYMWKRTA